MKNIFLILLLLLVRILLRLPERFKNRMAVDNESSFIDGPSTSARVANSPESDIPHTMLQSYKERIRARRPKRSRSNNKSTTRGSKSNGRVRGRPPYRSSKTDRLWNMLKRNGLNPGSIIHSPDLRLLSYEHLKKINHALRRDLSNCDEPEPDLVVCDEEIAFQAFEDEENFITYSKFKVLDITDCLIMEKSNNDNVGFNPNGYGAVEDGEQEEEEVEEGEEEVEEEGEMHYGGAFSDESSHSQFVDPGEANDYDFDITNERQRSGPKRRPKRNCKRIPYHLQDMVEFNDDDIVREYSNQQPHSRRQVKRSRTSNHEQFEDEYPSNYSYNASKKSTSPNNKLATDAAMSSGRKSNAQSDSLSPSPVKTYSNRKSVPDKSPTSSYKRCHQNYQNKYVNYHRDPNRITNYEAGKQESARLRQSSHDGVPPVDNQDKPLNGQNLVRARLLKLPTSATDDTPKSYLKIDGRLFEVNHQFNGQSIDVMIDAKVVDQLRQISPNPPNSNEPETVDKPTIHEPKHPPMCEPSLPPAPITPKYQSIELNPAEQTIDPNSKLGFRVFDSDIPEMLSDADPSEKPALVERFFKMLTKRYNKCYEEHALLHKHSKPKTLLGGKPMDPTEIPALLQRITRSNRLYIHPPKAPLPRLINQAQETSLSLSQDRHQVLRFMPTKSSDLTQSPTVRTGAQSVLKPYANIPATITPNVIHLSSSICNTSSSSSNDPTMRNKSSIILNPYSRISSTSSTSTTPTIISTRKVLTSAGTPTSINGGKVYTINNGSNKLSFILPISKKVCASSISSLSSANSNNKAGQISGTTSTPTVRYLIRKTGDSSGDQIVQSSPISSSISSVSSSSSSSTPVRSLNLVLNPSSSSSASTLVSGKPLNVVVNSPSQSTTSNKFQPLHQTTRNTFRIVQSINGNKVVVCDKPLGSVGVVNNQIRPGFALGSNGQSFKISTTSLLNPSSASSASLPKVIVATTSATTTTTKYSSSSSNNLVSTATSTTKPIVLTANRISLTSSASSTSTSSVSLLSPKQPKVNGMPVDNVVDDVLNEILNANFLQSNCSDSRLNSVNTIDDDNDDDEQQRRTIDNKSPNSGQSQQVLTSDSTSVTLTETENAQDELNDSLNSDQLIIDDESQCEPNLEQVNESESCDLIEINEPTPPPLTSVNVDEEDAEDDVTILEFNGPNSVAALPPPASVAPPTETTKADPISTLSAQPLHELMTTMLLLIRSLYFSNQNQFVLSNDDLPKQLMKSFLKKSYTVVVRDCINTLKELDSKQNSLLKLRDAEQEKNRKLVETLKGLTATAQPVAKEGTDFGQLGDMVEHLLEESEKIQFTALVDENEKKNLKLIGNRLMQVLMRDIDFNGKMLTLGEVLRIEHRIGIGRKLQSKTVVIEKQSSPVSIASSS